jgi:hypothetical protein
VGDILAAKSRFFDKGRGLSSELGGRLAVQTIHLQMPLEPGEIHPAKLTLRRSEVRLKDQEEIYLKFHRASYSGECFASPLST